MSPRRKPWMPGTVSGEQIIDFVAETVFRHEARDAVVNEGAVPAPVHEDDGRALDVGKAEHQGSSEYEQEEGNVVLAGRAVSFASMAAAKLVGTT